MANETTNAVRKALKGAGFNSKAVSVKIDSNGIDLSILVTILVVGITRASVEAIVGAFRDVSGDKGGNTWITVSHSDDALIPGFEAARRALEGIDHRLVTVGAGLRGRLDACDMYRVYRGGDLVIFANGLDHAARQLAGLSIG